MAFNIQGMNNIITVGSVINPSQPTPTVDYIQPFTQLSAVTPGTPLLKLFEVSVASQTWKTINSNDYGKDPNTYPKPYPFPIYNQFGNALLYCTFGYIPGTTDVFGGEVEVGICLFLYNNRIYFSICPIENRGGIQYFPLRYKGDYLTLNDLNTYLANSFLATVPGWHGVRNDEYPTQDITIATFDSTSGLYCSMALTYGSESYTTKENNKTRLYRMLESFKTSQRPPTPTSPEWPGDTSGEGGANGNFDNQSDPVGLPDLRPINGNSILNSGFISLYNPSITHLQRLSSFLWSDDFLKIINSLNQSPIDVIISLSVIPFALSELNQTNLILGNVNTNITMGKVSTQIYTFDLGNITISEYFGNFLDYSPNTQVEIYLPFIGYRDLDTDKVMGKTLNITYYVDVLSLTCNAFIIDNSTKGILYSFSGNCGASVPFTSGEFSKAALAVAGVGAAVTGVVAVATGGASLAAQVAAGAALGGSIANAVVSAKRVVKGGGDVGANDGLFGILYPFITINRPRQSLPQTYAGTVGYPSNMSATLGDCSGFTSCSDFHLDGVVATTDEKEMISNLLKEGIII